MFRFRGAFTSRLCGNAVRLARAFLLRFVIEIEPEPLSLLPPDHRRAHRVKSCGARDRRGLVDVIASDWRRCAAGPNRISSIGVWKQGARRMADRINRTGDTKWHRPYRPAPANPGTHRSAP